ncbi:CHAT domain-containing protein [Gloeocapsa sp. PCC 73106]|uniref:CHAT domain-containing protein n=1 Tax=Gloeocapsa sp. PCC 73106 TaxID=102232 RepID=UPI0002AC3FA5|nr:CHAT domain-containing protein [Gloeocapsa sp. PCC 73106]ELR97428.1 hypothetical protein GLO73106DRAFT_00012380 [Gloeocapsa sp. PCC 73106]
MKNILLFSLVFILTIVTNLASSQEMCNSFNTCLELAQTNYESGQINTAKSVLENTLTQELSTVERTIILINLGLIEQEMGNFSQAERLIKQAKQLINSLEDSEHKSQLLAQSLDVQGQIEISSDNVEQALTTWKEAAKIYQNINNLTGLVNNQIYQIQALKSLGLYAQAYQNLNSLVQELSNYPDSPEKAKALHSLGDILRRIGLYEQSEAKLQESLAMAQKLSLPELESLNLLSLGKINTILENYPQALAYYQQVLELSPLLELQLQAQLNKLNLVIRQQEWEKTPNLIEDIERKITQLPKQPVSVDLRINFAEQLMQMKPELKDTNLIIAQLTTGIEIARAIAYIRGEAEATGKLGSLYEQYQQLTPAQTLTEKALLLSQSINALDLTYRWQWQLGRILAQQGKRDQSIIAYTQAVNTLKTLRQDLVAVSSEIEFSFREEVEPVYRELVDILLQPEASQQQIKQAREVIEALQLAELDNFFRDACLDTQSVQIDQLDTTAGVIYPIILAERLAVILAIPNQPLSYHDVDVSQTEIEKELNWLSAVLQNPKRQPRSQLLSQPYDWLIKPIEDKLTANGITTLVFVLDGDFRNIPPGVFFDGEQYLIEKYNIAIAPSLQLVNVQTSTLKNSPLLLAGLTEARQGFSELPGVQREINTIRDSTTADVLLNADFTKSQFEQLIQESPYDIVHLATHGKFSSRLEDTFILTWDDRIGIQDLTTLLDSDQKQLAPVELLVLSACQTALGDQRATLGLAGIAVRVGARSTIASLWEVGDESTSVLMQDFYNQLINQGNSKGKSLRNAQINLLQQQQYQHPYYWSAFILLGNWM